ncbi:hypothetical protein ACFWFK_18790 [Micromonospora chalcea]
MVGTFEELVAEAEAAPVEGWGFDWLRGRATEERPPWGYARLVGERMAAVRVVDLREATLRAVFHDIGAVVWFLRKVVWTVPGFTVGRYRDELRRLDERIRSEGPFVAYARRFLIEARRD